MERWKLLMRSLDLPDSEPTFMALEKAYREPQRHYHTTHHIDDCLTKFDILRADAGRPEAIELALWFHDAIYLPYRSDNEVKSADWAANFLAEAGGNKSLVASVRKLILATCHDQVAIDADTAILIDVDLSILGADGDRYDCFERNVRKEYRWIPSILYRRERKKILNSFRRRDRIYVTDGFFERYESQARDNLDRAILRLG